MVGNVPVDAGVEVEPFAPEGIGVRLRVGCKEGRDLEVKVLELLARAPPGGGCPDWEVSGVVGENIVMQQLQQGAFPGGRGCANVEEVEYTEATIDAFD